MAVLFICYAISTHNAHPAVLAEKSVSASNSPNIRVMVFVDSVDRKFDFNDAYRKQIIEQFAEMPAKDIVWLVGHDKGQK